MSLKVNESHSDALPSVSAIVSALEWNWGSRLPGLPETDGGGRFDGRPFFEDAHIAWLLRQVDVNGKSVLDLGCREGGHSYMLENAGAKVVGVEANVRSFMKSLIVKNIYNLNASFLLGDFVKHLESPEAPKYDLIVAAGVLYHMSDPLRFLTALSKKSDVIFVWTHYYDPERPVAAISHDPEIVPFHGKKIRLHRHSYGSSTADPRFWGGIHPYSKWIERQSIFDALSVLGYTSLEVYDENPKHPTAGGAFNILAKRAAAP